MENIKEKVAVSLVFLPTLFAIASMIVDFNISDLLYLILVSFLVIRYFIKKKFNI